MKKLYKYIIITLVSIILTNALLSNVVMAADKEDPFLSHTNTNHNDIFTGNSIVALPLSCITGLGSKNPKLKCVASIIKIIIKIQHIILLFRILFLVFIFLHPLFQILVFPYIQVLFHIY